uniref:Peptidase M12A domain-containing protein n=1 Tax=Panagrolaimus superbus TaxID=310955 RepID=A0A914Y813_9BILA
MTLNKFKEELGTYFLWEEVEDADGRLIYFKLTNLACGRGHAIRMGGSLVELSTDDQCDVYSYLKNVLTVLGFTSPHLRKDRDNFVIIHYDNMYPLDHDLFDKCYSCITSDDEAFKEYDYMSLLHAATYSYYA